MSLWIIYIDRIITIKQGVLVDSNVLVYALNTSSPKCLPAREFRETFAGKFYLAHQNVMETIRIISHAKFPHHLISTEAVVAVGEIVAESKMTSPNYETLSLATQLVIKHKLKGARAFNAYLVATMISNEIFEIATDNVRDFRAFRQIKVINPFSVN